MVTLMSETRAATAQHWKRDDAVESHLGRAGVEWEYLRDIPIAQIDGKASAMNQARWRTQDRIMRDLVDTYGIAMLDGDVFPALVAYRRENGLYVLMGGNHRLLAAKAAGIRSVDAYLVKSSDPMMVRLITTTLNNLEGVRSSADDNIEQAKQWLKQYGRTIKEAAAWFRVKPDSLAEALRAEQAVTRLDALRIEIPEKMARSTLSDLNGIPNDRALQETASLMIRAGLRGDEATRLIRAVRDQRTEDAQIATVEQWANRPEAKYRAAAERVGVNPRRSKRGRLFSLTTGIVNLAQTNPTLDSMGITAGEGRAEALKAIEAAKAALARWGDE